MPPPFPAIAAPNAQTFVSMFGDLFEHSPWVAARAWRPEGFPDAVSMIETMMQVVAAATAEEQLSLLRAHPELAGEAALAGALTPESEYEQASAGLDRLEPQEIEAVRRLNAAYRERHGFPFILCVRHYTKRDILSELERRTSRSTEREHHEALAQVACIAVERLEKRLQHIKQHDL
ncbi:MULTISPECIES: 2-oxo-4-hydroxy-4-carboxy-5-ureidoimidazoline decarboxylase [unclassified Chelatococcus]|uniref:2-oxo-4-hydroxy-4-carboxy-5-ureidoimidazoline decarboxylase n=1 Tax=unclassified Chelatococcus TaxID=2638111 RepID=UPI001BCC1CB5|nr:MULTISPECIES: 2-oxo-4-hydroxy-4-carboxy-5-ureidoimidazoline decarboxylase [unclassified Chelatococcus]CAH1649069.1 2-oxo-4-hydroxy-4-carboxy-5-ureidoimidazoline decarboxylase [Hyphomicrobiales bacterium]MBS7741816.1 2-oxo-4-hydroxy-4-carboxy-5-ureidoimidazoline decarboxylase [Chelatococcus sp. HY11]MBX3541386.1 2-oxo-4-hydroxy-4-carboxy-5-ureidoimidazoline decarboxylase [Chelatococcus sp.]MCO5074720.1 2-oxo-4-hydroxy-4-carboxy-5-ureidoimidazoline decarboxylase [Chelatococcus sp.]CAH1691674.